MFPKLDQELEARMYVFEELNCACIALDRSY